MKKLRSPAFSRQRNAIFPSLIHQTWPEPFSGALYCLGLSDFEDKKCTWLEGFGWVATFFILTFIASSNKVGKKPMGTLIYNLSQYKIVHSLPIAQMTLLCESNFVSHTHCSCQRRRIVRIRGNLGLVWHKYWMACPGCRRVNMIRSAQVQISINSLISAGHQGRWYCWLAYYSQSLHLTPGLAFSSIADGRRRRFVADL